MHKEGQKNLVEVELFIWRQDKSILLLFYI